MKRRAIISIILTVFAMIGTYNIWHHAPVLIFISIMILSFLFSYKITDYIADFKTVKNHSRLDIIFLLIFFILLCIPASHISKAEKSDVERRNLAKKAQFIKNNKINLKYGKDFDSWFNDRFALRKNLIKANTIIAYSLSKDTCRNNKITFYKKYNFMDSGSAFGPKGQATPEMLEAYRKNINRLQNFCDNNNIKLYILIVPRQIEFFDFQIKNERRNKPDSAEEAIEYIQKNTKTPLIYPKEAMKEANKETPVYFKTDHHWTKKGAYVGYLELMKEIKKDFPDVPILEESSLEKYYDNRVSSSWNKELDNGRSYRMLGLPDSFAEKILDTPYLYYKNPNNDKLQTDAHFAPIPEKGKNEKNDNQFYYPDGLDKKVMVIGNSFAGNLVEFLPYSFKYTARYYDNDRYMYFETYEETIKEYKPDIIIINMYTTYLKGLLNLYPNEFRQKEKK